MSDYTLADCIPGDAFLEESKTFLRVWQPGEGITDFCDRVLSGGLLAGMNPDRARVVQRVFANRYLHPDGRPALALKRLLERGQSGQLFSDLCLLYTARNNALLHDVITALYWPAVSEKRSTLTQSATVAFLRQAARYYRIKERWSEQVKIKVAKAVLNCMTDFGLLGDQRNLVRYCPTGWAMVYLAYDLHFTASPDAAIVYHDDWRLFGFNASEVPRALEKLGAEGWWLTQVTAGSIGISWKYSNMDEVVDALAG